MSHATDGYLTITGTEADTLGLQAHGIAVDQCGLLWVFDFRRRVRWRWWR